ncbi:MAG: hypothetical protein RR547_04885 [Raoultibacter sp.]
MQDHPVEIPAPQKTMEGWQASEVSSIYDYLQVGDRVNEEMVDSFRDATKPQTNTSDMMQGGEPYSHIGNDLTGKTQPTFITFITAETPDGNEWVYAGNCFEASLAPNTADLAEALPLDTRIASEFAREKDLDKAAYVIATDYESLQQISWRDEKDQPHEKILTSFAEARELVRDLYDEGHHVNWHCLDSKEPAALKFAETHTRSMEPSPVNESATSLAGLSPSADARISKASAQSRPGSQPKNVTPTKTRG